MCALLVPAAAHAGLSVSVVSAPSVSGNDHPKWTGTTDNGGNTSVANDSDDSIKHSSLGGNGDSGYFATPGVQSSEVAYFQRDRDLGQTFTYSGTTGRKLDRITIKTGAGTNTVRAGTYGQAVSLQVFRVTGSCTVNNNGSTTYGKHGYPHGPATSLPAGGDDYCTGETYTSLAVVTGGTFPAASAFGCSGTPDPNASCLKGKYLRFDLTGSDEVTLTNGETYAFLLMIDSEGTDRGFTLANDFDGNPYSGGHSIRREATGTYPPTAADPTKSITDSANATARAAGNFGSWSSRTSLSPGTNGYPDVDTHRDHWFVVETAAASSGTTVTDSATNTGWGKRDVASTVQTGVLQVRSDNTNTDNQRKSWMRFDLSNDGITWSNASSVKLELKVAEQPGTSSCNRTLTVYAMPTSSTWPSGGVSWNSGPSNNTSSAWAFNSATQLGTYALPCQESVGSVVSVDLDVSYFQNDSDKIVILGMSYGQDNTQASFKAYESGTNGPKMKVTYDGGGGGGAIKINFQPGSAASYSGYLVDDGSTYGARNGQTYGWNATNTANTRDRDNSSSPDQRYDTLNHMQNGGTFTWELAVTNGTYSVKIVAGDASYYDSVFKINAENVTVVDGTPSSGTPWIEGTANVTVSDGKLTISNGSGASNNKIAFIEVTPN